MKWSWRIARIGGVDIYVHATFLLLLAWVGFSHWSERRSIAAAVDGVSFVLAIFSCVVLHELGHALAARKFGIPTRDITLLPIGGLARLERMPDKPLQEMWVAVAGPLVNVVIAASLFAGLYISTSVGTLNQLTLTTGSFVARLMIVNIILVVFNLIPAFPMDGGRVLRAFLALSMDYTVATQVAATVGQAIALVFGFLGFFVNPWLLFIALFVWIGAAQEASMTQMKMSLSGIPARRAMLTDFRTVAPEDNLSSVMDLILAGSQTDFPVVDSAGLQGILTRSNLLQAVAKQGPQTPVADVMQRDYQTVSPGEMLEVAFNRLQQCPCRTLPVVHSGQLVGLITAENIGEFLMIQSALESKSFSPNPQAKAEAGLNTGPRLNEP
jgi:Zn-dependent protease/CBS domain-containing protein